MVQTIPVSVCATINTEAKREHNKTKDVKSRLSHFGKKSADKIRIQNDAVHTISILVSLH
jgi:hypothetical protein